MKVGIERIHPRGDIKELPVQTTRGYELVDPRITKDRHHVRNSTFVKSIEEAARLVEQGFFIRMSAPRKRASLIASKSLRVVWTQPPDHPQGYHKTGTIPGSQDSRSGGI